MKITLNRRLAGLIALVLLLLPAGCAVNPVSGRNELVLMSEQDEIALGRKENPEILKQYGRCDDAQLQRYVTEVGERLATHSDRPDLVYHFTVVDSTDVNAFALPGGYIYITRGLLAYLNSEAELAAVLGHEIGHVTARHAVRQYTASTVTNMGITLGAIFVPELRGQGAQDLMNTLGTALVRGYGRDHELEADRLGAEYLARSGYDPQAMIRVLKVLKSQEEFEVQLAKEEHREPHIYHGVFATHPDNDTRLHQVVGEADKLKGVRITRNGTASAFLRHLEGLTFGPGARDGILRGRNFYHRDLDIGLTFPAGWRVENQPERLLAIAPQQAAVLQVDVSDLNQRQTPQRYLEQRFKTDTLAGGEALGTDGYSAIIPLNTSIGRREARVTALFNAKRVYLFVGIAKEAAAERRFDDPFLATARSLHTLSAAERALAQPLRIHIITAVRGTTFEQLAAQSRIPNHALEQLRLMNDRYPRGEPAAGEPLKIVK